MSVLRPRNRLVYFRLSEDEYSRFVSLRDSTGSRSISDFARLAVQNVIENGVHQDDRILNKLHILENLVDELSHSVQLLSASLRSGPDTGADIPNCREPMKDTTAPESWAEQSNET